jgi:hypothetical protein
MRSIERQGLPLVLASLTPAAVNGWVDEQRKAGRAEDGIASRLGAIKIFTNKYVYKYLELTTRDLLLKVPRMTPPEKPAHVLTEEEITRRWQPTTAPPSRTSAIEHWWPATSLLAFGCGR